MSLGQLQRCADGGGVAALQAQQAIDAIRAKEPPTDLAVSTCISAWWDLSTERSIGIVVGPIPWSKIVAWCRFRRLDRDLTELVVVVIRQLDNDRAEAEAAARARDTATGKDRRR